MSPYRTSVRRDSKYLSVSNKCKLSCKSCTYCTKATTKGRRTSGYCKTSVIKICEQCFLCRSIVFYQTCTKCPNCCKRSACRGQTESDFGNLESLGCRTKGHTNVERGLYPPFPNQTKLEKISDHHKLLCQSPHEPLPVGGITSAFEQKCSRVGQKSKISGIFNWLF